uniref:Spatacsin C-terminal domain-containing protein n=1 Tax=Sinocyclocheilus grahami TaxID=75366 RepID=A0A672P5I7_SINGR
DGCCVLLLNTCLLLQLRWTDETAQLETLSCVRLASPLQMEDACADCRLCRGTLFILLRTGLAYVFDSTDGKLLASVDFASYCSLADVSCFCLFQISQDLSTAVSITRQNQALAVDLNHYFRCTHLMTLCCLCHLLLSILIDLFITFDADMALNKNLLLLNFPCRSDVFRSWEARLSSLYSRSKAPERPAQGLPWFRDFPHVECRRAAATAKLSQPSVKPGGAVTCFDVPDGATAAGLNVSEFSALVTFVCPGNTNTVLAYWDLEGQSVTYHRADAPAAPVQRSAEEHLCLLLKPSGLSVVLFCVTQDELLNRLMVFGTAGTVDSLCHLNAWGRCSIPIHALQAGLKNHQLDTVDFFLKSKENILSPASGFVLPVSTQSHLRNVQALCPALDLLRSAIHDTHTEAQSQQFCDQLLSITLTFLNTQTRVLLTSTHELDVNLQECVQILDGYISDLRRYMKKFPWPHASVSLSAAVSIADTDQDWPSLSDEVRCVCCCAVAQGSWDAAVLWSYLTSLHDGVRASAWVCSSTAADVPRWPALAPHVINHSSRCGQYLRDQILDLLARQGLFVQSEMEDFQQLLWRLGQAGGVMHHGKGPPVPQEFHQRFVLHCLENSLQYLLYCYLEHYRLTPGNCPLLTDRNLFESFPWFEMMLKLQKITRDLKGELFGASLTAAQVLLPGSQASISSMLLEGHSLLALSTIMFRPGGMDQAVREGERGQDPLSRVDPQLLRMALSAYPKLRAALFPQSGPRCDVSLYHLLQALHPLDPSRLFGWQSANATGEASSEPPHFSSSQLVSKLAVVESLDFLYYLSHGRPAFAYGVFITQHLLDCSNVKLQICKKILRICILCRISSYEAALEWALPVQFCHLHALPLSPAFPQDCARDGQWLNFLLFVQLHNYPLRQVRSLAASFSPALQSHISLAFQDLHPTSSHQAVEDQGSVARALPRDESPEPPRELFQVLLESQEKPSPWRFLLSEAVRQRSPALSVLAACHQAAELLQCLCVWILASVGDDVTQEATAHIQESPAHHVWNLHDLSVLWKTLLCRSKIRPLIRGFQLFQRESPLIYMLHMYEFCSDYKDYQRAKDKLLDFQKCLLNLRSSSVVLSSDVLPVQWVESQASALLLTLLKQSRTQYELRRLLQLLVDMERLLKSNGPDFRKLSQLSQVLSDTPVPLSAHLLDQYSSAGLQDECRTIMQQLQDLGLFTQARTVAQLAELPIDCLIIKEQKRQWERQETRLAFWRRCHEQLKTDRVQPEAASQFFLTQAEVRLSEPLGSGSELVHLQERCLLLGLAGHWLSLRDPPLPVCRLAALEERQWQSRIRWLLLHTALERQSLFAPSALSHDSFQSLLQEFSFSRTAALDEPAHLSVAGLPAAENDCLLSADERKALAALVAQLLDEGGVSEASRVCRYFRLFHRDVWLVLKCRGLASGELQPELHSPDGETRRSFMSGLSSFVVVPSPDDQVLVQLKHLVDQCCNGKSYCKQVLSLYELSKELQCSFAEISSEEPEAVLRKVLLSQQVDRYKRAQAFISVQGLQPDAVARLVSTAVLEGLLASAQEGETGEKSRLMYGPADGRDTFLQLAKLCGDPNLVGTKLMDSIPTVPRSELSCTVEILILAHDCFSLTCNMEGIVRVLQAARHLSHTHLAHGDGYGLLVRLLTGIGRYNEMTYVFDLLHQNHRFEMLLRKKVESVRDRVSMHLIQNTEIVRYNLRIARKKNSEFILNCKRKSQNCEKKKKNCETIKIAKNAVTPLDCDWLQASVLAEAYDYSPDWAELLYQKVVLRADFSYLEEFKRHRALSAGLFEDISKKMSHHNAPASCSQNLKKLLSHCEDVYTHYKLAYEHKFLDVANMLLQDSKTNSFLKDRLGT